MTKTPKVPKPLTAVDPALDEPIVLADLTMDKLNRRLDTGMKVGDAIRAAAAWWTKTGRRLVQDQNEASDNPGKGRFTPRPSNDAEAENWLPSGILQAKPWDDLIREEKLRVTKFWHHHHVRVPNIDPELYLRAKRRPGACFYCDDPACAEETLPNGEYRELCFGHFLDRYPAEAKAMLEGGGEANDP